MIWSGNINDLWQWWSVEFRLFVISNLNGNINNLNRKMKINFFEMSNIKFTLNVLYVKPRKVNYLRLKVPLPNLLASQ